MSAVSRQEPDVSHRPLRKLLSLAERVAVVTGGSHGIGRANCLRLAEAGATVAVDDLDQPAAALVAWTIVEAGGAAAAFAVAARRPMELERLAAAAVSEFGAISIWISNAGLHPIRPALEITEAEWNLVLDTNLRGAFFGAQAAVRRMPEHGGVPA